MGSYSSQTVLGVDLQAGEGRDAGSAELAAKISSRYKYLQAGPPARWVSADAYIASWVASMRRDRSQVRAVIGRRVGSVYAAAIAEGISQWQLPPQVILLDPQFPSMKMLAGEFHRDMSSISSLLSDDEIGYVREIVAKAAEAEAQDIADAAAELVGVYLEAVTAAFERVGLGDARDNRVTASFECYISWLSAAGRIDPCHTWKNSTAIVSSEYGALAGTVLAAEGIREFGRRIAFDVSHADLLRSDSVAHEVLGLLESG